MSLFAALPLDVDLTRTGRSPPENVLGEAKLVDFADKVYDHVSETCMIFPKEGPGA
ncbi:MAG: hypothetical protein IOC67_01900 [Methylobacterium sp.]|nr:hypothetical protein [Methylobacterium sp.]